MLKMLMYYKVLYTKDYYLLFFTTYLKKNKCFVRNVFVLLNVTHFFVPTQLLNFLLNSGK